MEITDKVALIGIPKERIEAAKKAKHKASAPEEAGGFEATLEDAAKENSEKTVSLAPAVSRTVAAAPPPAQNGAKQPAVQAVAKPAEPPAPAKPLVAEAKPAPETKKDDRAGILGGNLANLFKSATQEEVSPLERLTASMPEINSSELLMEIKKVEALVLEYVASSKNVQISR